MNTAEKLLDSNPFAYLKPDDLANFKFSSVTEMLAIPAIRHIAALRRWETFVRDGMKFRLAPSMSDKIAESTVSYNIQGIHNSIQSIASLERSELVFRPVMAIDRVYSYPMRRVFPEVSMLLVGSRTEYEIFMALGYGIEQSKLSALDLISYSPYVEPGDMHAMPYPDNSFDVVILGWVLAYSNDPKAAAREVIRVCRNKAIVSAGHDSIAPSEEKHTFNQIARPRSAAELLELFAPSVGTLFFRHDPHLPAAYRSKENPHFEGHSIATFEISK